ncbi:hypothetical protein Q8A67_018071 [Cirrhinus molitorella]|uniref:Uncharacterized protein n=1 Tax=Cirrhinus molitorella TaxID=172907 RepID=A0AA88PMW3_9TELE|nr:hypothetical protein Q8A67_018071 [Cirrhinus molitorella]
MDPPLHDEGGASPALRQKRSDSPEPSCVSMRSDSSKNLFVELKGDRDSQHRKERSDSPEPSCVSMRSDSSKNLFVELKVLTENPPLPLNDMNIKVTEYLLYKFKENSNNEQDSNS